MWFIEAVNDKPILVRLLQIGLALQNKQQGWFDVDTKLEQLPVVSVRSKRTDDLCKQFVLLRCDGVGAFESMINNETPKAQTLVKDSI